MTLRLLVPLAVLALGMPAAARSVSETHAELAVPAGKTPVKIYRPLARDACVVGHRPHQAGKLPLAAMPVADARDCGVKVAGGAAVEGQGAGQ